MRAAQGRARGCRGIQLCSRTPVYPSPGRGTRGNREQHRPPCLAGLHRLSVAQHAREHKDCPSKPASPPFTALLSLLSGLSSPSSPARSAGLHLHAVPITASPQVFREPIPATAGTQHQEQPFPFTGPQLLDNFIR